MTSVNRFRLALVGLVFIVTAPVWAEEPAYDLDIEPQPLAKALKAFAEQSGLQVVYYSELADGEESPEVSGTMTADQAMTQLLTSTDLTFETMGEDTVVVETVAIGVADERGASDSKNLTPQPVLMAQNQTGQPTTASSSQREEGDTSIVTGKVTDARTDANLKGAKVTIEETGRWTSTNDLGEFRFVNVPTGSATLTVSFLGYAGQSAVVDVRGDGCSQNFALRGGSEIEEIVVYGARSARALSLNQERTAPNSATVLASDFLGQFDGATISEVLRRAPGVAFEPNISTGEGANIIVRGLEPDFSTVMLNGVRLGVSNGRDRSASLNNILADSIASVTINKTLLPSQDSAGTGAFIEIETKGPLDRVATEYSFLVERGMSRGDFIDDTLLSATVSKTLGAVSDFGLSANVQYRERGVERFFYNLIGTPVPQYLPLLPDGTPASSLSQIDPRIAFPFEDGVDDQYTSQLDTRYASEQVENLSITLSAEWQLRDHTRLRLDYSRYDQETETFSRGGDIFHFSTLQLVPIDELGGEMRYAPVWEGSFGIPFAIGGSHQYAYRPEVQDLSNIVSFRGSTDRGNLSLAYAVGYSSAERTDPVTWNFSPALLLENVEQFGWSSLDPVFLADQALQDTRDGRVVSLFGPHQGDSFVLPLLNEAGFATLNDPTNYSTSGHGTTSRGQTGENERFTARFDATYRPGNSEWLGYVSAGLFFEESESQSNTQTYRRTFLPTGAGEGPFGNFTLGQFGLAFSEENLAPIGINSGLQFIGRADIKRLFRELGRVPASGNQTYDVVELEIDPRRGKQPTNEQSLAGYLETSLHFGKLEIIGGVRIERTDVTSTQFTTPRFRDEFGNRDLDFEERSAQLVDVEGANTDMLPRVLANYRFNDGFILRAGYFLTIARPQITSLNRNFRSISLDLRPRYGPNDDQPRISINEGNPDLKPALTDNFDVSLEYYHEDIGVTKLSAFYKTTENFLEFTSRQGFDVLDGVVLPNDPRFQNLPDNIFVQGGRPTNSPDDADIWGAELVYEKQFSKLPGAWAGFGVLANYLYTDSSKSVLFSFSGSPDGQVRVPDVRFNQSPEYKYTAGVTYNMFGLDASLSYTSQDRYLRAAQPFGRGLYLESVSTLDLRAEYQFEVEDQTWHVYLEATDLLKGTDDATFEGSKGGERSTPKIITRGSFLGGSVFRLGVRANF